jgi:hypothetical protein
MDNKTIYIIIGIAVVLLFLMNGRQNNSKTISKNTKTMSKNTTKISDVNLKSPCDYYDENKPIIYAECVTEILKESGCPNPEGFMTVGSLSDLRQDLNKNSLTHPKYRYNCYGRDVSKWPEYSGVPYVTGRYVSIGFPNDITGSVSLLEMEILDNRGLVVSYNKPVSGKNIVIKNPGNKLTDVNFGIFDPYSEIPGVENSAISFMFGDKDTTEDEQAKTSGKEAGEFFEIDLKKSYNISLINITTMIETINNLSKAIVIISNKPNREEPVYISNPIPSNIDELEKYISVNPPEKNVYIAEPDYHLSFSRSELPASYIRRRY